MWDCARRRRVICHDETEVVEGGERRRRFTGYSTASQGIQKVRHTGRVPCNDERRRIRWVVVSFVRVFRYRQSRSGLKEHRPNSSRTYGCDCDSLGPDVHDSDDDLENTHACHTHADARVTSPLLLYSFPGASLAVARAFFDDASRNGVRSPFSNVLGSTSSRGRCGAIVHPLRSHEDSQSI
jgi:hypothetical protein